MTPRNSTSSSGLTGRTPILRPDETCWRVARADRFALIVDAADYFAAARSAMLDAEHSILLIGWDFDLRIRLLPEDDDSGAPSTLGDFLKHLVRRKPHLRIRILKWDMSVVYQMRSQLIPMLGLDLRSVERIRLRFDSKHPWTAAHHQKITVIDDALAFCGGIDMTTDRWDTRDHLPGDERRRRPDGSMAGPWHDATTAVDGAAAQALGEIARARWHHATGQRIDAHGRRGIRRRLDPSDGARGNWPRDIRPQLRDVDVGVARTMPAYEGRAAVHEIEALYQAAIRAARKTIYLESQYFASTSICEVIEERLAEPGGPEVVVINPLSTMGWLEQHTMGTARDLRLASVKRADRYGRFGIFHPVNEAGEPIYVHAKVLVVDDRFIRVGSSNVNNRSMGFDTECDLALEPQDEAQRATILDMRDDLLAEHLDVSIEDVRRAIDERGSLLNAIWSLQKSEGRSLKTIEPREISALEEALAQSHLADPERPQEPEARLAHLAKRLTLRVPPSAWLALSTVGLAGLLYARRRKIRRRSRSLAAPAIIRKRRTRD